MIATVPPLWRDVDAYNQVTHHPLIPTYWGHGPAYCYAARVPLLLGEQLERWRGLPPPDSEHASSHLTNAGIWLLIMAQHLALGGAALYFVLTVSRFFWVRLALALAWASNALFYAFAHCVGSETLSLILIVGVAARGCRLMTNRCQASWKDWYVFAIGLSLCLLCRQVNRWLVLLLPASFLLSWAQSRSSSLFASGDRGRRWLRGIGTRNLRQAVIAMAIGLACLGAANSLPHSLARKTKLHPHSRIGFTFLWRLQFLKTISPESRALLLQKVGARTRSPDARKLIALLDKEGTDLRAGKFMQQAIPLLFPLEGAVQWERLDAALNQMAFAFLLPPTSDHLQAARTDFMTALTMPVTEISSYLFETTAYYFEHKDEMPACADLSTFRSANADQIRQIPSRHPYFQLWRGVNYGIALMIWFVSLLALIMVARWKRVNASALAVFGITLTGIGLLTVASTCVLGEFIPRYGLPMWQLLLLSLYTFAGKTFDLFALDRSKSLARLSIGSKQSAGQRPTLG